MLFKFLKDHWKILALTTTALAAAAVVIFFPPAIIASAVIALANTSAFAYMGAAAMPVAMATGAAVAAAAVYAVAGVAAGITWGFRRLMNRDNKGHRPDENSRDRDVFLDLPTGESSDHILDALITNATGVSSCPLENDGKISATYSNSVGDEIDDESSSHLSLFHAVAPPANSEGDIELPDYSQPDTSSITPV
jgi:hypothetical protein